MNSHVVRELVIPHVKIYRTQSSRIDLKTYKNLVYTEAASQINEYRQPWDKVIPI